MKSKFLAFPSNLIITASAVIAVLAPQNTSASTIWDGGGASPTWGTAENWSDDLAPTFTNTTDLSFPTSAVTNFNTVLGANRTVRSLTFGADVDTAFSVSFQQSGGGATGQNLTFDTDVVAGNATVTVDAGAAGDITLGSALGGYKP
jgi:hypothetical protein